MTDVKWAIKAGEFTNCNCSYGCPCQFNGLPTHGDCRAVVGMQIDEGYHGNVRLDGLKFAGIFSWPGAIHEGHGEAAVFIDERATELEKTHHPIFTKVDFEVDVDARRARLVVPGMVETRGEPILNPVTGKEHRVRIDMIGGFEYELAEIGRGWSKTTQPIVCELNDSYGQFASIHLCQSGIVH
jgi:hypothetical protein